MGAYIFAALAGGNFALKKATGDFILYIDADEELANNNNISDIIKDVEPTIGGWYVNVVSFSDNVGEYNTISVWLLFLVTTELAVNSS